MRLAGQKKIVGKLGSRWARIGDIAFLKENCLLIWEIAWKFLNCSLAVVDGELVTVHVESSTGTMDHRWSDDFKQFRISGFTWNFCEYNVINLLWLSGL